MNAFSLHCKLEEDGPCFTIIPSGTSFSPEKEGESICTGNSPAVLQAVAHGIAAGIKFQQHRYMPGAPMLDDVLLDEVTINIRSAD